MMDEFVGRRRARRALVAAALVCLVIAGIERRAVESSDSYHPYLSDVTLISDVGDAGTVAILALLGGFRGAVANMLWLKADQYWHQGGTGWYRMAPTFDAITRLDPQFILAWRTYGWHLAWNLHADAPADQKEYFLQAGAKVFGRGIYANPKNWELRMELAWLHHDRIRDAKAAIPLWKEALKQPDAPIYLQHMLAHAYARTMRWRDSMRIWDEVLQKDPGDPVALRYAKMWHSVEHDPRGLRAELRRIWDLEQAMKRSRGLPSEPFVPPAL